MALFIYIGRDGPQGAEKRPNARPQHLDHLRGLDEAGRIRFAGPLRNDQGAPCGTVVILEAENLAEARSVAEGDPYLAAGVFETIEVFESLQVFPEAKEP